MLMVALDSARTDPRLLRNWRMAMVHRSVRHPASGVASPKPGFVRGLGRTVTARATARPP
jgi:hypothetical protein